MVERPSSHSGRQHRSSAQRARLRASALVGVALIAVACSNGSGSSGSPASPAVTVMTRNLYFGADLSPLFSVTSAQLGPTATAAYAQMRASDIPARLDKVARELAGAKPDLVALQEAVVWSVIPNGQQRATVLSDSTAILLADVAKLGTRYRVAASNDGFSGALPVPGVGLVGLQDRDVILVRRDGRQLSVSHSTTGVYAHALTVHVAGIAVTVKRGFAAVDASAGGRRFHVVATHLEAYSDPTRDAQAAELLAMVTSSRLPTLVLGDVNSPAAGDGSATYDLVRQAGLGDAWAAANPGTPGYTCCRAADLRSGPLEERIDMVFTRGRFVVERASLVGTSATERTSSGLWPSDHAGVIATVVPPR